MRDLGLESILHWLCLTAFLVIGLSIENQDLQHPFDSLHKCKDTGEAYSASYLITKEHLINHNTNYNLTWVNCEMASFIMFDQHHYGDGNIIDANGTVYQSLDVLDFSVIHLSWFERLQKRYSIKIQKGIEPLKELFTPLHFLKERALQSRSRNPNKHQFQQNRMDNTTHTHQRMNDIDNTNHNQSNTSTSITHQLNRTVVIMPFLGSENGAGHSKLHNRLLYLQACFWSFYHQYPYIVAAVKNLKDQQFAKYDSSLPFYDVILIEDLPKSASLPVATVQTVKARLMDGGRWSGLFDYIFFTESDQLLMMRIQSTLYTFLESYPRAVLVPHRLVPYPQEVLSSHHHRETIDINSFITTRRTTDFDDDNNKNNNTTAANSKIRTSYYYQHRSNNHRYHNRHTTQNGEIFLSKQQQYIHQSTNKQPQQQHRLSPDTTIASAYDRKSKSLSLSPQPSHQHMDWMNFSCYLPRQHCQERKSWISIKNLSVPIIRIYGLQVALGNVNFHQEIYRACMLRIRDHVTNHNSDANHGNNSSDNNTASV